MNCGDPTNNNSFLNRKYQIESPPGTITYLSSAILICIPGYIFSDYSAANTITCTAAGSWSVIPNCISMLLFDIIFDNLILNNQH